MAPTTPTTGHRETTPFDAYSRATYIPLGYCRSAKAVPDEGLATIPYLLGIGFLLMDEPNHDAHSAEDRSNKTAEALRALRDGLGSKLENHRRRISDLEADLTARVLQIAEELAQEQAAESQAEHSLREDQIRKIRESLIERDAKIAQLQIHLADAEAHRARMTRELVEVRTAMDAVRKSECADCERLREKLAEAKAQLNVVDEREQELVERIEMLLAQIETLTQELSEIRQVEEDRLTHQAESTSTNEQELQRLSDEVVNLASERDKLAEQLAQAKADLSSQYITSSNEHLWLEKELESLEQSKKQLAAEFEALLKEHKEVESQLETVTLKNEQAVSLLQKAEGKILALSDTTKRDEEIAQVTRKFELALADAQKLKRENAQLQEELARRPETLQQESPELFSLRVERDALAARVAELESAPVQLVDEDAEQKLADLQRRFELSVDDLRELKQENARLREQLASAPSASTASTTNTAMDWQSQKARLLAALESEDAEELSQERWQERMTIEGTISITDRVVAEKDHEITELRAQLADRSFDAAGESDLEGNVLDKDEIIRAEREKLESLQKEWNEKLRTAELELSVQRATLARKEAELQQKLLAAEQAQAESPVGPDGKPRRKWLSALGLRDDEEKK